MRRQRVARIKRFAAIFADVSAIGREVLALQVVLGPVLVPKGRCQLKKEKILMTKLSVTARYDPPPS